MASEIDRILSDRISRRELMKKAGVGAGGVMMAGLISACGGGSSTTTTAGGTAATTAVSTPATTGAAAPSGGTIKIGFVSPRTGPAAGFGEPDPYVLGLARKALTNGLNIGGKQYTVEIIDKDGQANPQRGAEVAQELINSNGIDLMLATSTPETDNPVADACEAAGVPCVTTVCPWEAWYFGRGAKPGAPSPFKFTYHFSFGVAEFAKSYLSAWPQVPTNKKIGVMWPNDADGNAIRAALGPLLTKAGYTVIDPGAYADGTNDYSSQIAQFKSENCELFNSFPIPPDFATFWRQAAQQGFKPKIVQIAKTGLFPSQVEALGPIGVNIAGAAYWTPAFPYKSSLTGVTSQELGDGYEKASSKQWNQQLGPSLALFDVAAAVLTASGNPKDKAAVAAAMKALKVDTVIGTLDWTKGPVPNVVPTPIINCQWVKGTKHPLDLVTIENACDPNVPIQAKLIPYA
jgi:branched-chain amino acid transport system substrate-binding protein